MSMTFLLWLCIAAAIDITYRKCFNWLVLSGFGLAFLFATLNPELPLSQISLENRFIGIFLAFSILLIFYYFDMIGAGDVKFAAALGAWLGWEILLPVWALSCAFAVVHGLVVRSNWKYFFPNCTNAYAVSTVKGKKFIPYVTYLSLATIIVLLLNK